MKLALFIAFLLLIAARRLPAPIQEIPENPTPTPERSTQPKSEHNEARSKKKVVSAAGQSEVTTELKALVNKLTQAAGSTHDMSVFRSILADDFIAVDPTGIARDKTAYIDYITKFSFDSVQVENLDVRITSPTAATVIGIEREIRVVRGQKVNGVLRFGAKWMKRDGRWRCVGARFVSM